MQTIFLLALLFLASASLIAQPLKLLPQNPHYFQYQNKPTVLVGSGEHYGVVRASPGAITDALRNGPAGWVIYAESLALTPFSLQLDLPKGNYRAEWTNIATGKVLKTESVAPGGLLTAPVGRRDVVVRLTNR